MPNIQGGFKGILRQLFPCQYQYGLILILNIDNTTGNGIVGMVFPVMTL